MAWRLLAKGGASVVHLEGQTAFIVLARVENGKVDKLRTISPDCRLDAGALPFYWIEGVPEPASVEWLKTQIDADHADRALSVISMHTAPEATALLIDMARHDTNPKLRGKALFWLAQKAAEKQAAEVIPNAALNDPDRAVKERAVFALSQLPPGEGIPRLIELAKSNADPNVRKKAVFWLGQSKDPRATDFIAGVLTGESRPAAPRR